MNAGVRIELYIPLTCMVFEPVSVAAVLLLLFDAFDAWPYVFRRRMGDVVGPKTLYMHVR